jgi:glycosyltransferase involved in cell wall biosynthesis
VPSIESKQETVRTETAEEQARREVLELLGREGAFRTAFAIGRTLDATLAPVQAQPDAPLPPVPLPAPPAAAHVDIGTYLMVVPVPLHDVSPARFAGEGAFCAHLRQLKQLLGPGVKQLVVASPTMSAAHYERARAHLHEVDLERDGIAHRPLFPEDARGLSFWRRFGALLATLHDEVRRCDVLHTGISVNVYRPFEFPALVLGALLGKRTIAIDDIDRRNQAWMFYKSGRWSLKEYLVTRCFHDPLRSLQLHAAARLASALLLKGRALCDDYGHGRPNVRYFLNAAFSQDDVIPKDDLARKLATLEDPHAALELAYFGRLTERKGVDQCLRALALARAHGAARWRFHIIGDGEQETSLRALTRELRLEDQVVFHGALRFGPELFQRLRALHVLLAAPMAEDTPRSALDAMASGMSLLAFDTYYYRELADSGAVDLVPWPSVEGLAERVVDLCMRKAQLVPRARAAVEFARVNTQEVWLGRRVAWTHELLRDAGTERSSTRAATGTGDQVSSATSE